MHPLILLHPNTYYQTPKHLPYGLAVDVLRPFAIKRWSPILVPPRAENLPPYTLFAGQTEDFCLFSTTSYYDDWLGNYHLRPLCADVLLPIRNFQPSTHTETRFIQKQREILLLQVLLGKGLMDGTRLIVLNIGDPIADFSQPDWWRIFIYEEAKRYSLAIRYYPQMQVYERLPDDTVQVIHIQPRELDKLFDHLRAMKLGSPDWAFSPYMGLWNPSAYLDDLAIEPPYTLWMDGHPDALHYQDAVRLSQTYPYIEKDGLVYDSYLTLGQPLPIERFQAGMDATWRERALISAPVRSV